MSLLNYFVDEQYITVLTDTRALWFEDRSPRNFVAKVYPLQHLGMLLAVTGIHQLGLKWMLTLAAELASARNLEDLDRIAPTGLRLLWLRMKLAAGGDLPMTSTVYHFGWVASEGRFGAFAYRSEHNFVSERIGPAPTFGIKPAPPAGYVVEVNAFDDFVATAKAQKAGDDALPQMERLGIGGELIAYTMRLTEDGRLVTSAETIGPFE